MRLLSAFILTFAVASAAPAPPSIDLSSEFLVRLQGLGAGAATNAGDVNGDGVPDALVAVPGEPSSVFVVYGRRGAWRVRLNLPALGGPDGYRLSRTGTEPSRFSAVGAGDVNGDGVPDALVGYATEDGAVGEAYVVFGRRGDVPSAVDLTRLTPSDGYRITGPAGSFAGAAVASAGDVDGDGVPDALVGAPGPDGAAGTVYVVYGRRAPPAQPIALASLAPTEGYRVTGAAGDGLGGSVAGAGDVNGDDVPDWLLGAPAASHAFDGSGSVYVVYGARTPAANVSLSQPGSWGYRIDGPGPGASAGFAVDNAGDVDGDGTADALVGAPGRTDAPLGAAFIVYGRKAPPPSPIELRELPAAAGYRIADSEEGSGAGWSVAGLGDLTGDGIPDAIVGAIGAQWRSGFGAAYVVYGRRGAAEELDLAALRPADGYVLGGLPGANTGWTVADAGDLDGDGTDEAWVWAPNFAPTSSTVGATLLAGLPRPTVTPESRRAGVGRGRVVRVALRCSAARGSHCAGAVRLLRAGRIVASAGFSLPASANRTVGLRLNPGTARLLRRRGRLPVTVRAVATADPPAPATVHSRRMLLIRK